MSYLYLEPYEVRHEILARVNDLEEWMDLGLRDDEYIELDELEPLKQRIGEFMLTKNAVRIDGKTYKPILDRTNYVKVALTGIQLLEQPEPETPPQVGADDIPLCRAARSAPRGADPRPRPSGMD